MRRSKPPSVHVGEWRGKPCLSYRDLFRKQHRYSFDTKAEAEAAAIRIREELQGPRRRCDMPHATVRQFGDWWLTYLDKLAAAPEPRIKPRTVESYRWALENHIYDTQLAVTEVRDVWHGSVVLLLADLGKQLSRNSVRLVRATLHTMMQDAITQGIIITNPVATLGRAKRDRLELTPAQRDEKVVAFAPEEEAGFFEHARGRYRLLFRLYARAGLRLGEGIGLKVSDVDLERGGIHVRRTIGRDGTTGTPKGNRQRFVPVSARLADELREHLTALRARAMKGGQPKNEWVFPSERWTPIDGRRVEHAMKSVLRAAGLSSHFSPKSLRHTYACRMLEKGCKIEDLQVFMGHSTIRLTVDLYGKWRQTGRPAAVDSADDLPVIKN